MDTDGPHTDGSCWTTLVGRCGDHMRMADVGTTYLRQLWDHVPWQFCGPTCNGNSWEHMRWQFRNTNAMPFVGTINGCQFLGPQTITLLGPTCEGSCGDHIRMEVLENTCNLISGDNRRYYCWGTRRYQFCGLHAISVLGTTSYTGVNLKSPSSGVRILNCHTFSYKA